MSQSPGTPSPQDAGKAILRAARSMFESTGYASTTIKAVAATAGVAPAVVRSLYANKDRLFVAAMKLPFDPAAAVPELLAPGLDGMGERLVRMTLKLMGDPKVRSDFRRLLRVGPITTAHNAAAFANVAGPSIGLDQIRFLAEYFQVEVVDRIVRAVGLPDARLRVSLITSYLVGLTTTRYLLQLEPLASASDDDIVALAGPTIQALLDPMWKPSE